MLERYIKSDTAVPLPRSKYTVSLSGRVFDVCGVEVFPRMGSLGAQMIKLDWFDGQREYDLALVVNHAWKPIHVPVHHWCKISVLHVDGVFENVHPENLVWRFDNIECAEYPGYRYVPGYSRYVISRAGNCISWMLGRELRTHGDTGYRKFSVMPDVGPWGLGRRHRMVALAWLAYPPHVETLHVNHIDHVPGHDSVDNLEWCTPKENVMASKAHRRANNIPTLREFGAKTPVCVRYVDTGHTAEYPSKVACAEALGLSYAELKRRLDLFGEPLFHEGYQVRYASCSTPWRQVADLELEPYWATFERPVLTRDVRDGTITEYQNLVACSKALGISKDAVAYRVKLPNQQVCPDYLQYRFKHDRSAWRIPENYEQELLTMSWSKAVIVKDLKTGQEHEFERLGDCAGFLGISDATMTLWMSNNASYPVHPGQVLLKYKHDSTPWRHVADPLGELDGRGGVRIVLARNVNSGEVETYMSARECAAHFKIGYSTMHYRLGISIRTYPNGYQYKYRDNPEPWPGI